MSATMARQGGQVQQEQSDMRLALNMDKMAKGGVFVRRNRGNAIRNLETSDGSPRRKEVGSSVSWA